MATKDQLSYRTQNANGTWNDWVVAPDNALNNTVSPYLFTGSEIVAGTTYEFKVTRSDGTTSKISAADTNVETYYGTVVLASGAPVSGSGTFSLTLDGTTQTVVRTKTGTNSMKVRFAGNNWTYVAIEYVVNGTTYRRAAFNNVNTTSTTIGGNSFTKETAVLDDTSSGSTKEVTIKLGSTQAFTMYIDYNGKSSGSISVAGI